VKFAFLPLFFSFVTFAQDKPPAGVSADWVVRNSASALADQIHRIEPILNQAKPDEWIAKGAPDAYVRQLRSTQASMQYLIASTDKLVRDPERLTVALEAFFRMESMEGLLGSLRDGIRKYQSPQLADQLNVLLSETANNREKLRQHIVDLAATREQEFQVADQEAQRCRNLLVRETPAAPNRRSKSK